MLRSCSGIVIQSPAVLTALLFLVPMTALVSCDHGDDGDLLDEAEWREVVVPLPSGVACSVEVTTPPDGAVFPAGSVLVTGFATVGEAVPIANTTLAYIMDVSGSTEAFGGCGGDPNGDGAGNTVLDCEITALTELHEQAIALGTTAQNGVVVFGEGAAQADMVPGGGPTDLLTGPETDLGPGGANGIPDVEDVLASADSGFVGLFTPFNVGADATNFSAAISDVAPILGASTQSNEIVVMVSDGQNNAGPDVQTALALVPAGVRIYTFAVGAGSNCASDPLGLGSLQEIADTTGGTCTNVPDPSDLPDVLPGVIMSVLANLELTLDGAAVTIDSIVPALPEDGPATTNYSTTLPAPAPGWHTVCATATCTDGSGNAHPTECKTFRINTPPVARCEDVTVYADATCHAEASIDDGSFDPDGDAFSCTADPAGPYGLGSTLVTLTCTDVHGESSECTGHVNVVDVTPPTVTTPADAMATLWPPNHQYEQLGVGDCVLAIEDNCDHGLDPTDASIVQQITSDEEELAQGSGNTCDDAVIDSPPTSFSVRSERSGNADGRVYHVGVVVSDLSGNHTDASCHIDVPHDQGNGSEAIDSGCAFCVGSDCGTCSTGAPQCN